MEKKKKVFWCPLPCTDLQKAWEEIKKKSFAATNIHTLFLYLYLSLFNPSFFISNYLFFYPISVFSPWMFINTSCQIDYVPTSRLWSNVTAYLSPVIFLLHELLWLLSFSFAWFQNHFYTPKTYLSFPNQTKLSANIDFILNLHRA